MFKGLIHYLLIFSLAFPPGSLGIAHAQEKPVRLDGFAARVQKACKSLTDMLMVQRYPDAPRMSFQEKPSLAALEEIRTVLATWQERLKSSWIELLSQTKSQDIEEEIKMSKQAEALTLEVFFYFQAQYLYLANSAFLRKVTADEITRLLSQTEIQIPTNRIGNYVFYAKAMAKTLDMLNSLSEDGKPKTKISLETCKDNSAETCFKIRLNESKAYRSLETAEQFKDDAESFKRFSSLIVLENYIVSFAKLEYYLNIKDKTLKIPDSVLAQHPSLPFLYNEQKQLIEEDYTKRFFSWASGSGEEQLTSILKDLAKDPNLIVTTPQFLAEYRKILDDSSRDIDEKKIEDLKKIESEEGQKIARTFQTFLNFLPLNTSLENQVAAITKIAFLTRYSRIKSEYLSAPHLTQDQREAILKLFDKHSKANIRKNEAVYQAKVKAWIENFSANQPIATNESVLREMYETIKRLNSITTDGVDYQALLSAFVKSKAFKRLQPSANILNFFNDFQQFFEKDMIATTSNELKEKQLKLATNYFTGLSLLLAQWKLAKKEIGESNAEAPKTYEELLNQIDPEKMQVDANKSIADQGNYLRIRKDLYDWIQIGALLNLHDGKEVFNETMTKLLKEKDNAESTFKISIADFHLDEKSLEIYRNIAETKVSSRFPILTTKTAVAPIKMTTMDSARKSYEIDVAQPDGPMWKALKNKAYDQAKSVILTQMQSTKQYVQSQIENLSMEVNPYSFSSVTKEIGTWFGMTRLNSDNIHTEESLALHLAYSTVLANELSNYSKSERLRQFRNQYFNPSDFQAALDQYINYTGFMFLAIIGTRVLSWITSFRIPIVKKFFPLFRKASSSLTRDGLRSIMGPVVKFRGQPLTLFGAQQTWFDLSFWGSFFAKGALTTYDSIDRYVNDIPFLEKAYENQIACVPKEQLSDIAFEDELKSTLYKDGCEYGDKTLVETQKALAQAELMNAGMGFAMMGVFLYVLPKALGQFQKMQERITFYNSKRIHNTLSELTQDIGFAKGKHVFFNSSNMETMTEAVLKDIAMNSTSMTLSKKIFVTNRYLQLKSFVEAEHSYWNSVDRALSTHWARLGINSKNAAEWAKRYDIKHINEKIESIHNLYLTGKLPLRTFEKLYEDINIIAATLRPTWKLLAKSTGENNIYAEFLRQIWANRTQVGKTQIPTYVAESEITKQSKAAYSGLFYRTYNSEAGETAFIFFGPHEFRPEALQLIEKIKVEQFVSPIKVAK